MASKDYVPRNDNEFTTWLDNFSKKLPTYATPLGITAAQVTQVQTNLTDVGQKIKDVLSGKKTLQSLVEQKDAAIADTKKYIRDMVVVMKRNGAYTPAIGSDLGVVAPASTAPADTDSAAVEFSATVLPNKVRLDWVKGAFDGVVVQSKRGSETAFTTLDKDTVSPYDDARPNLVHDAPETRVYRMRYLIGDDEVGVWSNEVKTVCVI